MSVLSLVLDVVVVVSEAVIVVVIEVFINSIRCYDCGYDDDSERRFSGEPPLHDLILYRLSAILHSGDSVVSTSFQLLHHIGNHLRRGLAALAGQMAVGLACQLLATEIEHVVDFQQFNLRVVGDP